MSTQQGLAKEIDLSILSEEARKELTDFYLFLVERYGVKKVNKISRFQNLILNPLKVKKINIPLRESLYER